MPARALAVLILLFAGAQASARPAEKGLSRLEAAVRASLVRSVDYELSLRVDGEAPDFAGEKTIRFSLTAPADGLTVDFDGGSLERLEVNGRLEAEPDYNGLFLALPKSALRAGENVVRLAFRHPYSATGAGLYRFKDPEDGRVYLYSNFEPFDANKLFPCFDQPDLKATFQAAVEAPSDWEVVSTAPEEKTRAAGSRKIWTFAKTPKLSAYVFSVHAGPYHVWRSTASAVPLRLFARESVAKYVDAADWLNITREGLEFYGRYFDFPYPFKKYDQLIVPDFNAGAMENIGAVTFSERYVHRGKPTLEDREDLASTILHEMAHMWFGDLVTLRWWDGLWLNESFATYMEALSSSEATEFRRAWQSFFIWAKQWAYTEDQRVTTHPIEGDVPDTEQAFANFDGITYGKGASSLKQLAYLLGEDKFRDGVRLYLKTHAYGNAEEADFFGAMAKASGVDLAEWTRQWLNTAGVNTVRAEFSCDAKGDIGAFSLVQTAPSDHPQLRRHRAEVGLYGPGDDGALTLKASVPVAYDGPRTEVPQLVGKPCPSLVYPNRGDHDFAKVELDSKSLEAATSGISGISDPLLRAMLWNTLWEMVRDARWPATAYADLALSALGAETDFKVAKAVLENVYGRRPYSPCLLSYLPKPDYPRLEAFFWKNFTEAKSGGDFQKLWFDGFVKVAAGPDAAERLRAALTGSGELHAMTVDQDRRWDILARLNELDVPDAEALLLEEAKRDPSDKGAKSAATARAARPDPAAKTALFAKITDPGTKESLGSLRAAMAGFFPRTQAGLREDFIEPFLKSLPEISSRKDDDFLEEYGRYMIPSVCSTRGVRAIDDFLAGKPPLKAVVLKSVRNERQEEDRCVRIRARLGGAATPRAPSREETR